MKTIVIVAGAAAVVAYAMWGVVVMNNLGLVAGSGLPLEQAVATMAEAGQPASMIPGSLFLAAGLVIAAAWSIVAHRHHDIGEFGTAAGWCLALMLGAPAYFQFSFWNVNSLGDTFYDWHMEAVFALARPLYLVSGAALIGLIVLALQRGFSRPPVVPATALPRR